MENNIKKLRLRAGLTQKELSERSGVPQCKLSGYEALDSLDKITLGSLDKIANAFNVTVDYLITPFDKDLEANIFYSYLGEEIYFKTDDELSAMDPNDLYNYLLDVKKDIDGHAYRTNPLILDLYCQKVERSDIDGLMDNLVSYTMRIVPYVDTWDCYPPIKDADTLKQHAVRTFVSLTKQHKAGKKGLFTFKVFERYYDGYPFDYWSRG